MLDLPDLPLVPLRLPDYTNVMPESSPHIAHNRSPSAAVFVGRQREMAALRTALEHAQSGQGQLVMLVGEPGIGKTSIAKEFTE